MGLFNFYISSDKKLLKEISRKLDQLLADNDEIKVIVKATEDLKTGNTELKSAVEKNKQ